jgi:hypothetical protein
MLFDQSTLTVFFYKNLPSQVQVGSATFSPAIDFGGDIFLTKSFGSCLKKVNVV